MIRIAAISQNLCTNDKLKQLLQDENVIVEECYKNSVFLPDVLIKQKPNIILWDIDLYNYFDVILSNIYKNANHSHKIVFLISNKDKRRNILKNNNIPFITAPIMKDELLNVIHSISYNEKLSEMIDEKKLTYNSKIATYKNNNIFLINLSSIYFFSSSEGQTIITTKNDEIFACNHTLKYWNSRLSVNHFYRCHRCFIINLNYIKQITPWYNNTLQAILINSKYNVPISRNYIKDFKELIGM